MKIPFAIALAVLALPAAAHPEPGAAAAFTAGLLHPLTGLDHLLAMLGIGLWSRQPQQSVSLPLAVLGSMTVGALGFGGAALPASGELALAAGVAVVGVAVAIGGKTSRWTAGSLVALLGLLHGQAHAAELPGAANAIGYLLASAVLLLAARLPALAPLQRRAGVAIGAIGVSLLAAAA